MNIIIYFLIICKNYKKFNQYLNWPKFKIRSIVERDRRKSSNILPNLEIYLNHSQVKYPIKSKMTSINYGIAYHQPICHGKFST